MQQFKKILLNIPHSSTKFPSKLDEQKWQNTELLHNEELRWIDLYTDKIYSPKNNRVVSFIFPYSRYYCDAERLKNDPLEKEGQGIVYKNLHDKTNITRELSQNEVCEILEFYDNYWNDFSKQITDNSLVIDCHSFPKDLSETTDICIGFNDDFSKPDESILLFIENFFKKHNYKVSFNSPYSNSVTPIKNKNYKSFMIEINKSIYLNDDNSIKNDSVKKINILLNELYTQLLD